MFPCFPQDVTETIIPLFAEVNVTLWELLHLSPAGTFTMPS